MKQLATNLEQNRFNMVEQQIRTWNVLDTNILDLLYKVRREEYVPAASVRLPSPIWKFHWNMVPLCWHLKWKARILQELHIKKPIKSWRWGVVADT